MPLSSRDENVQILRKIEYYRLSMEDTKNLSYGKHHSKLKWTFTHEDERLS